MLLTYIIITGRIGEAGMKGIWDGPNRGIGSATGAGPEKWIGNNWIAEMERTRGIGAHAVLSLFLSAL